MGAFFRIRKGPQIFDPHGSNYCFALQQVGRYVDSLGCKEPWKEYLGREVGWAKEALSRFTNDDKVPHRHTDLFRERKIRVMAAPFPASDTVESAVKTAQEMSR